MIRKCKKCKVVYDDFNHSVICPHPYFEPSASAKQLLLQQGTCWYCGGKNRTASCERSGCPIGRDAKSETQELAVKFFRSLLKNAGIPEGKWAHYSFKIKMDDGKIDIYDVSVEPMEQNARNVEFAKTRIRTLKERITQCSKLNPDGLWRDGYHTIAQRIALDRGVLKKWEKVLAESS